MSAVQLGLFKRRPTCKVCQSSPCEFKRDPQDLAAAEVTELFSWWCLPCYGAAERRCQL